MKRVLSLVLALVLVLGMIPTFAAGTGAEELKANGFISGNENGDLLVDQALTREQLAALTAELAGDKELAAIFEQPAVYADSDEISPWAVPFVAYAQEMGWMTGIDQGTEKVFKPMNVVTGPELAATLMNALGYTVEGAAAYATVISDAAELGIILPTGALTREVAFEAMWVAVSEVPMNGSDMTLGVFLGRLEPATPVVTDLAVAGVSATNLREVMVEFNNEIDKDTLDKANFVIGTTAATSVELSEDGMTVVAWFELANQATYTLKIAEIADVNGSEVKEFSQQFTINDFTAPTVVSVEAVGNKKVIVTFSEPVTEETAGILSNYKINDLLFGAAVDVDSNEVHLTLSTRLADGVHKFTASTDILDYAGFKVVLNNTDFVVAKDEVKPAVATIDSQTQTKVVITFTKPVEEGFTVTSGKGTFDTVTPKTGNQTWTLTFEKANPIPLSGTEVKLTGVTDYYGNTADLTINVIPTLDLTRPEVVSVVATAQDTLLVTFSKAVELPDGTDVVADDAFVIENEDEDVIAITGFAYAEDDDEEDITTQIEITGDFAPGDYAVEISGIIDTTVQANVVVPYTSTLTVADLEKPAIALDGADLAYVLVTQPDADTAGKIIIEFNEKVDAATALAKANYSYILASTKPVAVGTANTVTMLANGKGVSITVPKGADQITSVTIINVTDLAGNKMVSTIVSNLDPVPGAAINPQDFAPVAIARNKVVITVPTGINPNTVTASDFRIEGEYTTDRIYVINAEYSADDDEITLTLASNLSVAGKTNGRDAKLNIIAKNLADVYGNKITFGTGVTSIEVATVIDDQIAPTAVKVASAVSDATDTVITVNLTEAIDPAANFGAAAPYVVVKIDGVLVLASDITLVDGLDGTTPQLVITADNVADDFAGKAGKSYSVEYFVAGDLMDEQGVALKSFSFTGTLK